MSGGISLYEESKSMLPDARLTGELRLHLGCGPNPLSGWMNVDMYEFPGVDLVHDLRRPLGFSSESVDAIYTAHVLEHISYRLASYVLSQWLRVLKVGKYIQIAVPNLRVLVEDYIRDGAYYLPLIQQLYGGLTDSCYDTHKNAIDFAWLSGQLNWFGCDKIESIATSDRTVLNVVAVKTRHVPAVPYPVLEVGRPRTIHDRSNNDEATHSGS